MKGISSSGPPPTAPRLGAPAPREPAASADGLQIRGQRRGKGLVRGTARAELSQHLLDHLLLHALRRTLRDCHRVAREVVSAADHRGRLLDGPDLHAAARQGRVELLVGHAARLNDHGVVELELPVDLPVLCARLNETRVDMDVRANAAGHGELIDYLEGLAQALGHPMSFTMML